MAGIIGIRAGQSGLFIAGVIPANGTLHTGPNYSTPDAAVTLQPTSDPFVIIAAVAAGTAPGSFRLTLSGQSSNGAISNSFAIPILP